MDELSYEEQVARAKERVREVSPREAIEMRSQGAVFVDVREGHEWNLFRIPGALHVPLGSIPAGIEGEVPRDASVVVYCARGNRSALAADRMLEMGFSSVSSLSAGIAGWMDAGGDLEQ